MRILSSVVVLSFLFGAQAKAAGGAQQTQTRIVHVSAPYIIIGNELAGHVDINYFSGASIGFEYVHVGQGEEYSDTEAEELNRSMITEGWEGALYVARYSQPLTMTGFYWSLGVGYRQLDIALQKEPATDYGLRSDDVLDDAGRLTYALTAKGVTGHGRLGYRYAGTSFPYMIGGFLGFRHYESKIKEDSAGDKPRTTEEERAQMARMLATRPELAVEVGVSF